MLSHPLPTIVPYFQLSKPSLSASHTPHYNSFSPSPLSDFTHLVRPNEATTAQYYRAAQDNRDIWFTCPAIDFTWQYTRQSASNIRLYAMNQTKFTPIFQRIGIPHWRVIHLSDFPYILKSNVSAGGDNNPAQQDLSAMLSGSAAAFAYTGDPTISPGRGFKDWPVAYQNRSRQALEKDYLDELSL